MMPSGRAFGNAEDIQHARSLSDEDFIYMLYGYGTFKAELEFYGAENSQILQDLLVEWNGDVDQLVQDLEYTESVLLSLRDERLKQSPNFKNMIESFLASQDANVAEVTRSTFASKTPRIMNVVLGFGVVLVGLSLLGYLIKK